MQSTRRGSSAKSSSAPPCAPRSRPCAIRLYCYIYIYIYIYMGFGDSGLGSTRRGRSARPSRAPPCAPRSRPSNVLRFRGGLVFMAHRRLHHSTLGLRVIKKKSLEGARHAERTQRHALESAALRTEVPTPNAVERIRCT